MTEQHPITPPPELWKQFAAGAYTWKEAVTYAYRAGADQELEACVEWLSALHAPAEWSRGLCLARRPQPPSLKEQALEAMSRCDSEMWCEEMEYDLAIIRTALESLPS